MPIRIKPVHNLGVCILDLDSIKKICELVEQNFVHSKFSAEDDIWEVYDEDCNAFIAAIQNRETLDSFVVKAYDDNADSLNKRISITFNKYQATVKFSGSYDQEHWFEHFLIDLKKHLRPPEFRQYFLLPGSTDGNYDPIPPIAALSKVSIDSVPWFVSLILGLDKSRYALIVIKKKPPNAFVEGVKVNLISNLIWVIIVFLAGTGFAWFTVWLYQRHDVNVNKVNEVIEPPSVPPISEPSLNQHSTPKP